MKNGLPFKVEYDTNYTLIAIISGLADYQFAYYLNKNPSFLFKRMSSDLSYIINNQTIYFSIFEYNQAELQRSAFLIQNKSTYKNPFNDEGGLFQEEVISNTTFLIPEGFLCIYATNPSPHSCKSTSSLPPLKPEPTRFHLAGSAPRQSSCNPPRCTNQTACGSSTESSFGCRAVPQI